MGVKTGMLNGTYLSETLLTLRLFPDENKDTIRRLTKVLNVKCRIVESKVPALIIGRKVHGHLLDRKNEQLEFGGEGEVDHDGIKLRLDEMFEST